MSSRKAKKDVKAAVQQMGEFFESVMEKHQGMALQPRSSLSLILGIIPHLMIVAFTSVIVWTAKPSSSLFSWHPTLMSLAFAVLMSEAIFLFSPWFSPMMSVGLRSTKVTWHWVIQLCTMATCLTGFVIITVNKMINGSPHYSSWHGLLGVLLCGFLALQTSGGLVELYPGILPFKVRLSTLKRLHAFNGMLTFFGGVVVLVLGMYSVWFVANVPLIVWQLCVVCPPILGAIVFVQVIWNHFWWF